MIFCPQNVRIDPQSVRICPQNVRIDPQSVRIAALKAFIYKAFKPL